MDQFYSLFVGFRVRFGPRFVLLLLRRLRFFRCTRGFLVVVVVVVVGALVVVVVGARVVVVVVVVGALVVVVVVVVVLVVVVSTVKELFFSRIRSGYGGLKVFH